MNKRISIIVPIYNAIDDVKKLLESLSHNFNFNLGEVLLINDCSNNTTTNFLKNYCQKDSKFKLLNNEQNLGFIKTCNKGLKLTDSEIVVLLNSDTIIPQEFAERIVKCFDSDKNIGLASPISSNSNSYYIYQRSRLSLEEMNTRLRAMHICTYPVIPEAEGFCFCIRRKVIYKQGYLDEIYGKGYHEEVDFSYKAITNGWKIVLIDDLYVYHKRQATFGAEEREKLLKQNDRIFYDRWNGLRNEYKRKHNLINPVIQIEKEMFQNVDKKLMDYDKARKSKFPQKRSRILVHLHLYYHDQLDYMIKKLKNINNCDWDLYVTICQENKKSREKLLKFKPDTQILEVENRGYDIWPFIQVLRQVNIDNYDSVLKLHTKNFRKQYVNFIGIKFNGYFWRNCLINALVGSKKIFRDNNDILLNTSAGIIFDDRFLLPLSTRRKEELELLDTLKERTNIHSNYSYFCAGTMFMIKACLLKKIIKSDISRQDFELAGFSTDNEKYAHAIERIFTILTDDGGYKTCTFRHNKQALKAKIKFSFIMPTFNRAFCIEKSIESLLNQTENQNFELIIIDDYSEDDTENIIKSKYCQEIKNKIIRYVKLDRHRGVSYARNQGLKQAKNEWIAYLDSDNILDKDYIKTFSEAIRSNYNYKIFYSQLQTSNKEIIGNPFDYKEIVRRNYIDMGVFVHHKSLVKRFGGFDTELKRLVDWDLIVRYTTNERQIFINKILMYYNSGEHQRITNTEDRETALKQLQVKFVIYLHGNLKDINLTKILKEKSENRKTVFWGASIFLEYIIKEGKLNKINNIIGIIDKDEQKHGKKIGEYEIFPPEKLAELKPECVLLTIYNNNEIIYPQIQKFLKANYPDIKLLPNIFN